MKRTWLTVIVVVFLTATTAAVYWRVAQFGFVNYDDDLYVSENSHVQAGITWTGLRWAFTDFRAANWHPVTWISHMLDCSLFGMNAGYHHLMNLALHLANTLLLFYVLNRMSRAFWRSVFAAALFALHPLHVESVAWISERKDVLSTLFWLLTIWAYVVYRQSPAKGRYALLMVVYGLGLMAKPMLVTLPFVLILLDYWPLGLYPNSNSSGPGLQGERSPRGTNPTFPLFLRLLYEKLPLVGMSLISCFVTLYAQHRGGSVGGLEEYSIAERGYNAVTAYLGYIGKMLWPADLAVFYPYPIATAPWGKGIAAGLTLLIITVLFLRLSRRAPYLSVGWFWYLGTLVPVIGLVQVGSQSMADRYTYVPLIGLFIALIWGLSDVFSYWKYGKCLLYTSAALVLGLLAYRAQSQLSYWKNSVALFEHALAVTSNNPVAHNNLAIALEDQGRLDEAVSHYRAALRIKPDFAEAHNNLGEVLEEQGNLDAAADECNAALKWRPDFAEPHNNLAVLLESNGDLEEAMKHYREALRIKPDFVEAHINFGVALVSAGQLDQAVRHYRQALRLNPRSAEAHNNLGIVFAVRDDLNQALAHYRKAVALNPGYADAHKNLGLAYWLVGKKDLSRKEYRILKKLDAKLAEQLLVLIQQL